MCDKGPILGHLKRTLQDKKNTILLTGYQSPGTNGYTLLQLADISQEESEKYVINLDGMKIKGNEVQAKIQKIGGYFGHADQTSLLEYLFTDDEERSYTVPKIFLNHGNNDARLVLKEQIESYRELLNTKHKSHNFFHTHVEMPLLNNGFYDLDTQEWIEEVSFEQQVAMRLEEIEKKLASLQN